MMSADNLDNLDSLLPFAMTPVMDNTPHLMQHLWNEYKRWLEAKRQQLLAQGLKSVLSLDEAVRKAPATSFVRFCVDYLRDQRPVELFALDANYGFRLSNNVSVALCPGIESSGPMQDAQAVAVTEGIGQQTVASGTTFQI